MNTRTKKLIMLVGVCVTVMAQFAFGQIAIIERRGVTVTRSLSGHVDVGVMQQPAKGVVVELCSADWKTVLASTKTDDAGFFSLGEPTGKLFYIRLSAPGVNPYQLRVRVKTQAAHDLTIHLIVAT